ncbi:MAG: glycosyltransferase family 2 protein [Phaeodactylibacter xiamenensis]|uniref:glycosyltransferase family 2 protein n=1 Tax=Phaeodactylibacter xiamenensis TaxID=1524460 RepID=UPI000698B608|nr:glycosyltransferase family 2 protein [Phaeodactylibacter xiamenensis]MCR9053996.1 glycosyltransferase family 2 protein [bacterium]
MSKPIVSILTTVFNREKYLADCIESVLASTYQDWELIIVDDQSKDASVAIAQSYAAKDARIKVYENKQNLGDYPNRNQAAAYAQGKYLKYLDADDLIYPHGLQIMVDTMENHPECALGVSQQVAEDTEPYPFVMAPKEAYYREFLMRGVLGFPPSLAIIKKTVFDEMGGFSGKRYIGDTEFWLRLARAHSILKIEPGLVYWREHDDQEYQKGMQSHDYLINNFLLSMEMLNSEHCPLEQSHITQAKRFYKKRLSRTIIRLLWETKSIRKVKAVKDACGRSWSQILCSI